MAARRLFRAASSTLADPAGNAPPRDPGRCALTCAEEIGSR
ncbi:hypothetical protein [Gordonia spumicola]|nr:hypothetical protein [Gordonia spumicola]